MYVCMYVRLLLYIYYNIFTYTHYKYKKLIYIYTYIYICISDCQESGFGGNGAVPICTLVLADHTVAGVASAGPPGCSRGIAASLWVKGALAMLFWRAKTVSAVVFLQWAGRLSMSALAAVGFGCTSFLTGRVCRAEADMFQVLSRDEICRFFWSWQLVNTKGGIPIIPTTTATARIRVKML